MLALITTHCSQLNSPRISFIEPQNHSTPERKADSADGGEFQNVYIDDENNSTSKTGV